MKKILLIIIIIAPMISLAQQPKMDIRAFGGINATTFVYQIEGEKSDALAGWLAGAGFRVSHRRSMLEIDVVYNNYGIVVNPNEDAEIIIDEPIDIRMRALDFPLTAGYIVVKEPVFKWYLYGGLVSRISVNGRYTYKGEKDTFQPKELGLNRYNLGAKFGTQVDLAMFNFDFSYTIGITNAFKNKARTNTHGLQLTVGFLF